MEVQLFEDSEQDGIVTQFTCITNR